MWTILAAIPAAMTAAVTLSVVGFGLSRAVSNVLLAPLIQKAVVQQGKSGGAAERLKLGRIPGHAGELLLFRSEEEMIRAWRTEDWQDPVKKRVVARILQDQGRRKGV